MAMYFRRFSSIILFGPACSGIPGVLWNNPGSLLMSPRRGLNGNIPKGGGIRPEPLHALALFIVGAVFKCPACGDEVMDGRKGNVSLCCCSAKNLARNSCWYGGGGGGGGGWPPVSPAAGRCEVEEEEEELSG